MTNKNKYSKKGELIENAIKLFYEYGYKGTTIRRIAEASGVAHTAMFKHFNSKQELASIIIDRYLDSLFIVTRKFLQKKNLHTDEKLYGLFYFWSIHYQFMLLDKKFSRFYVEYYENFDEEFNSHVLNYNSMGSREFTGIYHEKKGLDLYLDIKTLSDIDHTLVKLCNDDKILLNKSVFYLLNALSNMEHFTITKEQVDYFIQEHIVNNNSIQYEISELLII